MLFRNTRYKNTPTPKTKNNINNDKNNQKTNNEIIKDIKINNNVETLKNENVDLKNNPDNKKDNAENIVTANKALMPHSLVYESATEKAKNLAPVFLIILSVLLNIVLIWRR